MREYIVAIHTMLRGLDISQLPAQVKSLVHQLLAPPTATIKRDLVAVSPAPALDAALVPVSLPVAEAAVPKSSFVSALDAVAGPAVTVSTTSVASCDVGGSATTVPAVARPVSTASSTATSTFAVPASKSVATPARVSRSTGTDAPSTPATSSTAAVPVVPIVGGGIHVALAAQSPAAATRDNGLSILNQVKAQGAANREEIVRCCFFGLHRECVQLA